MKKRILSLLLVLIMVLGMFPMSAMATETNDTVYISVSFDGQYVNDKTGEPMAYIPVSLSELQAIDLEEYGLTEYDYNGQLTALHLYIYTHEKIMGKDWSNVGVSGGAGSIFFENGLFGFQDCNLQYYCNGEYPEVDGWGVTADQQVLKDGDFFDIAAYTSWSFYSDSAFGFHYFLDNGEITHAYTATAGEALSVTLGRGASYMGGEYSMTKVSGYTVSYGAAYGAATGTVTTNTDGRAEITFDEAGTYYLWCGGGYGAENPLDIVSAPGCAKVTVTEPACTHETWNAATCKTPKTCAACGATEGEADPKAHSYVGGTCEYCGEPDPDAAVVLPFTATADGEAVEVVDMGETGDCYGDAARKLSVTVPAGSESLTINSTKTWVIYGDKNDNEDTVIGNNKSLATVNVADGYVYLCFWRNDDGTYHIYIYEAECEHNYIDGICEHCEAPICEADPEAHNYVDGICEYCGKPEIEPTLIVNAGTGWSSIEWPYQGCNINKVAVNNVKVDNFTVNGSNYYITLDASVADNAIVELGIGTNLQYSNLWVLVNGECITESPISASTELTHNVQLVDGAATVIIGGCPGYNTGNYIQQYAVNKTFHFSTKGQFPVAPMLAGGSSTSALRVQNETWSADLSTLFKNISDKELTYQVAIDGGEAVACDADYTYTCDTYGVRKLVFTAVNDYGTSPSYTATISVLPLESVKEINYEVEGGTVEWFAFTDDQLNPLPEGTTYEWDEETTTWTIIQPSDINVTGKVMTFYNLVKDDSAAKLPLITSSTAVAGAGTKWDGGVISQQTNTLSNGAVNAYVYLYETAPFWDDNDELQNVYQTLRFNYDRQKPETYFTYKVDGNAELTIAGDVGGVNGHQWTSDREVHVALSGETPADAIISCVEKSKSVTLSNGAGQISYTTGSWPYEQTWTVKYKIDEIPSIKNNEKTSEDVSIPALETYTIDLAALYTDADGDETLSYQVKLNDGSWTNVEGTEYSFTPESAQAYVLTFRAYDGFVYAEDTYTVNLTATNAAETYTVTVSAPEGVLFYCTAEFVDGIDKLGAAIEAEYAEGVYTLKVPANASQISWRKGEIGMSAAVEADAALILIEANFTVMAGETEDNGALTVKYGDYTAVGSKNSYLLLDGTEYSYTVTPGDTLYRAYNESGKTPIAGENVIELTLKHITVIAPEGSTVSSGRFYSYFRYDFNEAYQTTTLDDGRISVDFPVPGSEAFIRVQHPDGVTYWDFGGLSDGSKVEVTEAMLFIGSEEFTKETVYPNYEKNAHDTADLYMTVNAQGWLDMDAGDVHSLNVFRNWIPVANSTSNNGVSLPDVEYKVVSIDGTPSDVVEVIPDANNSCYADIKAEKAGTAIILVTYDAVYNADGEGGKQFSAIWPENTGVIVVTVDADDASIQTNITVNETANAGGKQILDVEHDILFYVGNEGAEYSFKPEDGCTVTVSRSTVDGVMSFDGFTNEGVTVAEDGTVTLSGLTTGAHIVKVEKDGKTAYQVIRAREVSYKLTHSDGTEVTDANPAQPGESITVQFTGLIAPLGKLSGVYNANFGFYYNGEDGAAYRVASGYAYGDYYFGSNAVRQRFTATVPAEWDEQTYTLTDGGIKLGGFGGSFGAHRSTTYMTGKEVNTNASGTAGVAAVLPDVVIPVDVAPEVDTTLSSYIFNSDIDGTGWGRADAAYADKLTLFGAGVDDLRWDGDTCYVTLDKKTANNAGIGFVITYKATMDSWLDGLKATVNGESMNANEMLFTQLTNGTLTAEVYVTNNDIASQSGTKTFVITVADETACDHEWTEANCTVPKTCKLCGVTRGDVVADGHNYVDGKCGYCGNYVGIDIATGDTASGTQDIRISDFYVNAYGAVLSNTIVEDGRATVQIKAPLDELELTISMFGKKGMVLSKAALTINDGDAVVPTSVDKDNNVAVWVGTVTPEWNGNKAEIKVTVGFAFGSEFKSPKDYILTLEKVEETPEPATYTVTLPTGTGYTVAATEGSTSPVAEGGSYSFTVTVVEDYDGTNMVVKANDVVLTAVEGIYTIENITADQTITVEGVEVIPTYTVTLPTGTGYTVTATENSASPVTKGGSYSFTVTISEGYEAGEDFAVKANDVELTAVEGIYTIENITADQTVTVEGVVEKQEEPALTWQEVMAMTQTYLTAQAENKAPIVGTNKGEWMVLGLSRNGMNADNDIFKGYYDNVVRFVEEKIDAETGRLDKNQATVNARVILGLTSIGRDVTNVAGHNLLKGLSDTDFVKKQGINGPVWALIALDSHDYEIPANADSSKQVTREWLVDYILDNQLEGGGWKISGTSPDDMTPMAVQALAPYYNSNADVKAAIDKALTIMEGMVETGSPETLAQIIVARSAMGLDSEEIVNKMLAFALEDGSFKKSPSATNANQMSTEQAFYSMVAYSRFLNNKTALYDMSDVVIEQPAEQDKPVESVTLSSSTLSMKVGETDTLVALVSPADATNRTVSWSSSNTGVATVSSNGVVTAVAEGSAIITATAGEKSASCIVTVTKASSSEPKLEFGLTEDEIVGYVTISFEDNATRKSAELSEIESEFRSPLGTIIRSTRVPFKEGDTIASVTLRLLNEKEFTASYEGDEYGSFYLEAIGNFTAKGHYYSSFGEFDAGRDSGWMITWNGWFIDQGASEFEVKNGDVVRWQYTCQLGADIGDVDWNDTPTGGNNTTSEDRAAAREVKGLIEAIGTVTKDSGAAIKAARSAYNALTDAQKDLVPNYDDLVAAEKKYAELTKDDTKMVFTDVSESDYYYEAVKWAVELGITNGTSDTTFSPNASCTRAQMVTFLWRAAGSPEAKSTTCVFTDVDKDAYYYEALLWAVENGITNGTSDTAFSPDADCNRGQMATFLYRSAKTPVVSGNHAFNDVKADAYYNDAVIWAAARGITKGTSDTTFSPDADCTRGQMVTFLYRYLAK